MVLSSVTTYSVKAQTENKKSDIEAATESARNHFRTGVDLYRERNFRAAIIEFQRAYKAYPNYKLLYNLGQVSVELQEYVQAIDYFAGYLRAGGNAVEPQRRQEVEQAMAMLETRLARISVSSNQEGATVFVDDASVGVIPVNQPIRISSGRRRVSATKPGLQRVEQVIDIAAGDFRSIQLDFTKTDEKPVASTTTTETVPGSKTNWPATIAAVGTGAFAVAAGAMAVVTWMAEKDYEKERETETTKTILNDLRDKAKTKAVITDVLLGCTVAGAIVTTVLIFTHRSEDKRDDNRPTVDLALTPTSAAVLVGGRL